MRLLSTKRSATRGILLEIKGENNVQLAEKLTKALQTMLGNLKMSECIGFARWLKSFSLEWTCP